MAKKMVIENIEIEVIKKNIKNLNLSVLSPHGKVRISVPMNTKDEEIRYFVNTKISWVKKQIDKFEKQMSKKHEFISGECHYFWGRPSKMEVRYNNVNSVEIIGDKVLLSVRDTSTTQQREDVMKEWYRMQLKYKLPELFAKWEKIIGV